MDHLHRIRQGRGNRREGIGRSNEEDTREIEGHIEIMIRKGKFLFRVEGLEKRGRRVPSHIRTHFIHFVEHEHRVGGLSPSDLLNDPAGKGSHIGSPVSPNLGFVSYPSQRDPDELSLQSPSYGASQGRLAYSGRADKAEDGTLHGILQFLT